MNLQSIMNKFTDVTSNLNVNGQEQTSKFGQLSSFMPGGLAGGAAAGGLMALLVSNKSARKMAGTAASFGGAALLGGLAYKAYNNWQHGKEHDDRKSHNNIVSEDIMSVDYQLTLVKAMIAAAKADGHIDPEEQKRIFEALEKMDLDSESKATIFDLLHKPISMSEIAGGAITMEQKTELYLVSCMIIDPDHPDEVAHLAKLAAVLDLPPGLAKYLQTRAEHSMING